MINGVVEISVAGVPKKLFFGFWQMKLFCKEQGIKPSIKLYTELLSQSDDNIDVMIDLFYSAALAYCEVHKQPVEFTKPEVSNWIMAIGPDGIQRVTEEAMKTHDGLDEKNQIAPQVGAMN